MKYIMLTGTPYEKVMGMNVFIFFALLDSADAVQAENSIRELKIAENQLLLKSKYNSSDYPELMRSFKETYRKKGINIWHSKADFNGLAQLKAMLRKK